MTHFHIDDTAATSSHKTLAFTEPCHDHKSINRVRYMLNVLIKDILVMTTK